MVSHRLTARRSGGNDLPSTEYSQQTKGPSAVCKGLQVAAAGIAGGLGGAVTGGTLGGQPGALAGAIAGALVGAGAAFASQFGSQGGFLGGAAAAIGSLVGHMTQGTSVAGFLQVATDTGGGVAGDDHPAGYIGTVASGTAAAEGVAAAAEGTEIGAAAAEGGVAGAAGAVVYLGTNQLLSAALHAAGCP